MATALTVIEKSCLLPTDDNAGRAVQVLGSYIANLDYTAPGGDVKEAAIVAITNVINTATQLTDSTKFRLAPGGIYVMTFVGASPVDATHLQLLFSSGTVINTAAFTALPAVGATNAIAGDLWPVYANPSYTFTAKPGQLDIGVMVRGSITTGLVQPFIAIKRLR